MSVYVFTGPTISPAEASGQLDAVYLPPASEGDVYRVTVKRPQAIGIIDGYFQSTPTVRHKEILWAMSRGIHVFGSASIGALRAAELNAFGMEGVGTIFEFYRDGLLEDDDEVAIAHGPAEVGFAAGSEAMVNIRQTLRKAEVDGVISTDLRTALEKIGKELFYPDRSYPALLSCASGCGMPETELERLRQWLPQGRVNQKREDALNMLRLMRQRLEQVLEPKIVSYSFEHTSMWDSAWRHCGELRFDSNDHANVVVPESVLNELRLEGKEYRQHSFMALERFFAIRQADRLGITVTKNCRKEAELAFRQERDLAAAAQLEQWINDNGLSHDDFDTLMRDEARVSSVRKLAQAASVTFLPDQLRLSGDYPRLLARAEAKERLLESFGLKHPCLKNADLTENQLLRWYFEDVLGQSVPQDNSYSRNLGFASPDAFRRALLKEYLYRLLKDQTKGGAEDIGQPATFRGFGRRASFFNTKNRSY
ncbi:MAG: hypothetical protein H0U43_04700 [Chthoniobacterales bacterium]|nr:hypothetical protein [Chthoniobacterales bacterium]